METPNGKQEESHYREGGLAKRQKTVAETAIGICNAGRREQNSHASGGPLTHLHGVECSKSALGPEIEARATDDADARGLEILTLKAWAAEVKAEEINLRAQQAALKAKEAEVEAKEAELQVKKITLRTTAAALGAMESALETKAAALDARENALEAKESAMSVKFPRREADMRVRTLQEDKGKDEKLAQTEKLCKAAQEEVCFKDVEIASLTQEVRRVENLLAAARKQVCLKDVDSAISRQEVRRVKNSLPAIVYGKDVDSATSRLEVLRVKYLVPAIVYGKYGGVAKLNQVAGNQPTRPQTPFFLFYLQFRDSYIEDPEAKGVAVVVKAGEKWKEMSEAEKAPYIAKAQPKIVQYEKDMEAYNKQKLDDDEDDDEENDVEDDVEDDEEDVEEDDEEDDEEY